MRILDQQPDEDGWTEMGGGLHFAQYVPPEARGLPLLDTRIGNQRPNKDGWVNLGGGLLACKYVAHEERGRPVIDTRSVNERVFAEMDRAVVSTPTTEK